MYFFPYFVQKKEDRTLCLALSPLRQYNTNTFSREMQIDLIFRNSPRNVKRRVLHTWGFVMYYITRRCSGVAMERRKSTPDTSPSVLVACVCPLSAPSSFLPLWLEYLPILLGICWGFGDLFQGFAKIMAMCAASRFFVLPLQNTGTGVLAWSAPPLLSSCWWTGRHPRGIENPPAFISIIPLLYTMFWLAQAMAHGANTYNPEN